MPLLPLTLGELKSSEYNEARTRTRSIKDELRENLIRKLERREQIFAGIVVFEFASDLSRFFNSGGGVSLAGGSGSGLAAATLGAVSVG